MDNMLSFVLPLCNRCVKLLQSKGDLNECSPILSNILGLLARVDLLEDFDTYSCITLREALRIYRRLFSIAQWGGHIPQQLLLEQNLFHQLLNLCQKLMLEKQKQVDCVFIEVMQSCPATYPIPRYLWRESYLTWIVLCDFVIQCSGHSTIHTNVYEMREFMRRNDAYLHSQMIIREMMENDSHLFELLETSLNLTHSSSDL